MSRIVSVATGYPILKKLGRGLGIGGGGGPDQRDLLSAPDPGPEDVGFEPPPPPPPAPSGPALPTPDDPSIIEARRKERKPKGRAGTILTGGQGLLDNPFLARRILLAS